MTPEILILVVAFVVIAVMGLEMLTAVLPLLVVVIFVPPAERAELAAVLAAADSGPRLRFWSAANVAVLARRRQREAGRRPR
jgi:hypothetical protein